MSNSIIGAGAGPGSATETSSSTTPSSSASTVERKLRFPTEQEYQEIQGILRQFLLTDILVRDPNPKILADYLSAHPDLNVNDVYCNFRFSPLSYNTRHYFPLHMNLYGMLMLSPIIDIQNPLLQELMRRQPHPEIVSTETYNPMTKQAAMTLKDYLEDEIRDRERTLRDFKTARYPEDKIQAKEKEINILKTKLKYAKNMPFVGPRAKNLSSLQKSGLDLKYPENVVGKIGSFLTGKEGFARNQMNLLRKNVGLSSLKPEKQNKKEGGITKGGKRKGKGKKSLKRKSITRKGKKSRRL